MSALQASYEVAPGYGTLHHSFGARHDVSVARALPSAGQAGRHLRLVEQLNQRLEDTEAPLEEDPVITPGVSLMWLDELYSLVARHDPDSAIDLLFANVDDLLSEGAFRRCDALLKTIDPKRLDSNLLVAALSATKRAAPLLHERQAFVRRVRTRLQELAPDRLERLLAGLD